MDDARRRRAADGHALVRAAAVGDQDGVASVSCTQLVQQHPWCSADHTDDVDAVTLCLLFVHALAHTRPDYTRACLPFAHLYACLLHVFAMGESVRDDPVVYNLLHVLATEYAMPQLVCANVDKAQLLTEHMAIGTFTTMETV